MPHEILEVKCFVPRDENPSNKHILKRLDAFGKDARARASWMKQAAQEYILTESGLLTPERYLLERLGSASPPTIGYQQARKRPHLAFKVLFAAEATHAKLFELLRDLSMTQRNDWLRMAAYQKICIDEQLDAIHINVGSHIYVRSAASPASHGREDYSREPLGHHQPTHATEAPQVLHNETPTNDAATRVAPAILEPLSDYSNESEEVPDIFAAM